MSVMAVNKVVYGTTVLVDLTEDTVTPDKLLKGETAHNAAGEPVTGTMEAGIDTSDATATAGDIAEGKTAYVDGEKITGSLYVVPGSMTYSGLIPSLSVSGGQDEISFSKTFDDSRILKQGNTLHFNGYAKNFGDATAEDVAEGKTFTSAAGLKVTGTAKSSTPALQSKSVTPSESGQTVTPDDGYDGLDSVEVGAIASDYVGSGVPRQGAQTITPGTSDQKIASGKYLNGDQTIKGDANLVAGNIKSGVSIFGVAGSFEGSGGGGGSSDNNCEAYHITSASAKLNFKGTGTVKVWGYGTATSGYSTSVYAFVGDGYYKSAAWGSPTKTSASFSVNADGTLNGLPSMSACNLLVTIGV